MLGGLRSISTPKLHDAEDAASPPGASRLFQKHPDITVYTMQSAPLQGKIFTIFRFVPISIGAEMKTDENLAYRQAGQGC